jgi:hypothetical protein
MPRPSTTINTPPKGETLLLKPTDCGKELMASTKSWAVSLTYKGKLERLENISPPEGSSNHKICPEEKEGERMIS